MRQRVVYSQHIDALGYGYILTAQQFLRYAVDRIKIFTFRSLVDHHAGSIAEMPRWPEISHETLILGETAQSCAPFPAATAYVLVQADAAAYMRINPHGNIPATIDSLKIDAGSKIFSVGPGWTISFLRL